MPRASDGTVTLPVGNPVVAGTAISADVQNATIADLASMIEDSLSRSGDGGMTVPMQFAKGTDAAPSVTFVGDTNTGVNSDTADQVDLVAGGVASLTAAATGVTIPGTLDVTGNTAMTGDLAVTGDLTVTGNIAVTGSGLIGARAYIQINPAGVAVVLNGVNVASASWAGNYVSIAFTSNVRTAYFSTALTHITPAGDKCLLTCDNQSVAGMFVAKWAADGVTASDWASGDFLTIMVAD